MATGFVFFDLPLELRNFVYRALSRPLTTVPTPNRIHPKAKEPEQIWEASVESYLMTALLTVNKQFKAEYERQIYQTAILRMRYDLWQAIGFNPPGISSLVLPGCLLASICHVEFDVILRDWSDSVKPMLKEKYDILRVCNLPNIQSLKIDFTIPPDMPELWLAEDPDAYNDISELFVLVQNFCTVCKQMFRRATVDIGIYVKAHLFEPFVTHLFDDSLDVWSLSKMLNHELNETPDHETISKASPAEPGDQHTFEGMRLEFVRAGQFNANTYDDLLEDVMVEFEYGTCENESQDTNGCGLADK